MKTIQTVQFDSLKLSRLAFAVVNHAAHVSRGDDGKKNEPQMSSRLVDLSLQDTILPLFSFLCLLFSAYQAIFNQWIAAAEHVSVYMPEDSCCESVSHLQKKKRPPPSLGIMGLETIEGSHVAFQGEETGPPSPLIGGEVEWHLYYARRKIHNGAAAQCRGALHSLFFFFFLRHPLFQGVGGGGKHEETAIPRRRQRSYVRKFSS